MMDWLGYIVIGMILHAVMVNVIEIVRYTRRPKLSDYHGERGLKKIGKLHKRV